MGLRFASVRFNRTRAQKAGEPSEALQASERQPGKSKHRVPAHPQSFGCPSAQDDVGIARFQLFRIRERRKAPGLHGRYPPGGWTAAA